jgi:hypothetical protein
MTALGTAFEKIRSDRSLAKEFTENPAGVLQNLGVDTTQLKITKTVPVSTQDAVVASADISACVSVGCIVCASIG